MLGALDADFVWECKQVFLKYRVKELLKKKTLDQEEVKDMETEHALLSLDEISTNSDEPPDPKTVEQDYPSEIESHEMERDHSRETEQENSAQLESDASERPDDYLSFLNLPVSPSKSVRGSPEEFIQPSDEELNHLMDILLSKTHRLSLDALEEYLLGLLMLIKSMDNELDRSLVVQKVHTKIGHI
jgi:hypothetical protein